jgi:hypothetical protein
VPDLVVGITQRRTGYFDTEEQNAADKSKADPRGSGDFTFRRGCTLVVNFRTRKVRWTARTAKDVCDAAALDALRQFLMDNAMPDAFHSPVAPGRVKAPFAALHRE